MQCCNECSSNNIFTHKFLFTVANLKTFNLATKLQIPDFVDLQNNHYLCIGYTSFILSGLHGVGYEYKHFAHIGFISPLFFISHSLMVPQKSSVTDLPGTFPYIVMVRQKSPGSSALYLTVIAAFPPGGISSQLYSAVIQSHDVVVPFMRNTSFPVFFRIIFLLTVMFSPTTP